MQARKGATQASTQCIAQCKRCACAALRVAAYVPGQEDKLRGRAAVLGGHVQVDQAVSAVARGLGQLSGEVVVALALRAERVDHNLRVVHDLVDKVAVVVRLALQFEVVELRDDIIVHTDAGGLEQQHTQQQQREPRLAPEGAWMDGRTMVVA